MNQQPHTHKIEIRKYDYSSLPTVKIEYGDQKKMVWTWVPGWKGRIDRKVKRIIAKHDRGSQRAHLGPEAIAEELQRKHNKALLITDPKYYTPIERQVWGSEVLKEADGEPVAAGV